ncbi:MAG: outer membrane protein assembly factor BamA, partial [Acinetobacter sp.]|nr:outer membrane protein assembly factor BamA [Acinetobacter sp.]
MIGSRLLPIAVAMAVVSSPAQAESFVMSDIRLEGLARLSAASVYGLMPYAVGDVLTNDRSSEIVQALFASGQFEDVQVLRDGNAIIVRVVERPSVSSIEITGNKSIGTEELIKGLKSIGLAEGEVFKRAALDQVRLELQRQYAAQGRYGATVIGRAKPLPRNRVAVSLEIKEGDTSRIAKVTINGNKAFKDATLLKQLQLRSSRFLSFIYGDDKYSREKLSADLETLRSYYLDRGYLRFNVTSTQVSLSPEKDQVYIDINVEEGEPYKISEVRLAGELPVEEAQLRPLLLAQPGQT